MIRLFDWQRRFGAVVVVAVLLAVASRVTPHSSTDSPADVL